MTTPNLFSAVQSLFRRFQVLPWLAVQPDVQYIVNPGGGGADPDDPTRKLRNELVAGARVITTF